MKRIRYHFICRWKERAKIVNNDNKTFTITRHIRDEKFALLEKSHNTHKIFPQTSRTKEVKTIKKMKWTLISQKKGKKWGEI